MTRVLFDIVTDLPPDEIARRLTAAVDPYYSPWGRRPVRGRVGRRAASLYRRRRLHHPFETRLRLLYPSAGAGAPLRATADIGGLARIMLTLATLVLAGAVIAVDIETGNRTVAWLAAGVGALGIGLIYAVGRGLAQGDGPWLADFAAEALDGRAEPVAAPARR